MNRKLRNIIKTYNDSGIEKESKSPPTQEIVNLTIADFNARGEITNPRAPCVVTTIDPAYTKQAALQRRTRRFRFKTDILTLREVVRTKFMVYATQERALEKQREAAYQERIFEQIMELQKFAADILKKSESSAFAEMRQAQMRLEQLQKNRMSEELKSEVAEHQRVLIEVQEAYRQFLFLLKLIGYFDDIIAPEDMDGVGERKVQIEVIDLEINEQNGIEKRDVSHILNYMNEIVRPYLAKRNHLNSEIWLKGYERTGQKIFSYNRRFHQLALLNHLVSVVYDKAVKTNAHRAKQENIFIDPQFFKARIEFLNKRSLYVLDTLARSQEKDHIQIKLNAILPVILNSIEARLLQKNENGAYQCSADKINTERPSSKSVSKKHSATPNTKVLFKTTQKSTLNNVEKIQWHVTNLLQELESIPTNQRINIEKIVRKRVQAKKDISRRNLIKQNRLENWIGHFKKHALMRQ